MTVRRREDVYAHPHEGTTECDGCGRLFLDHELRWGVRHWVTVSGRTGAVTASLCGRCRHFAWEHCWRCGRLCTAGHDECWRCRYGLEDDR
jgi:hypothetical protein